MENTYNPTTASKNESWMLDMYTDELRLIKWDTLRKSLNGLFEYDVDSDSKGNEFCYVFIALILAIRNYEMSVSSPYSMAKISLNNCISPDLVNAYISRLKKNVQINEQLGETKQVEFIGINTPDYGLNDMSTALEVIEEFYNFFFDRYILLDLSEESDLNRTPGYSGKRYNASTSSYNAFNTDSLTMRGATRRFADLG